MWSYLLWSPEIGIPYPVGFPTYLAGVWPGPVHVSGGVSGAPLIEPLANLCDGQRRSVFFVIVPRDAQTQIKAEQRHVREGWWLIL